MHHATVLAGSNIAEESNRDGSVIIVFSLPEIDPLNAFTRLDIRIAFNLGTLAQSLGLIELERKQPFSRAMERRIGRLELAESGDWSDRSPLLSLLVIVRDLYAQIEAILLINIAAIIRAICEGFNREPHHLDLLRFVGLLLCRSLAARLALRAVGRPSTASDHCTCKRSRQRNRRHAKQYLLRYGLHHFHHSPSLCSLERHP